MGDTRRTYLINMGKAGREKKDLNSGNIVK